MATLVIALVYLVASAALDALLARRVLWEVDQRLTDRLAVVSSLSDPLANARLPDDAGTDGAPVFVWWVSPAGSVTSLTEGSPPLAVAARGAVATPLSLSRGGVTYRYKAIGFRGGELIAGQDLAAPSHIEAVMRTGEIALAPVVLLAVFAGVLVIGVRAAAPVEAGRRRLQELTADASHELRTPLTVIEAEIELALSSPPDPVADREALDHVARESTRLKVIVEDLLWLARFDAAPPPPANEPVDLVEAVSAGAQRFAPVAASRDIELATALDGAPVWIDAAPEWLDRLAGTLLDNACRYAPRGGTVRVLATAAGGRAVLVVEDDGPGIPAERRETLFDRFRRATDQPGGAGLGLAIADSVVRSTGGRWRIGDSALGGARMEVSWRRVDGPARADGARARVDGPARVDGHAGLTGVRGAGRARAVGAPRRAAGDGGRAGAAPGAVGGLTLVDQPVRAPSDAASPDLGTVS